MKMIQSIIKSIKLFLLGYRLRFAANINYRTSLISHSIAMLAYAFLRVAILLIAGSLGQGILGWNNYQLILFAGIHQLFVMLVFLLIFRQMYLLIENIYFGRLDYDLTKPIDSQLAIALKGGNLNNVFGIFLGIGMISFSLIKLRISVSIITLLGSALFLIIGVLIAYSIMFACSILNIWFDRLQNARDLGLKLTGEISRFPVEAYHKVNTILYFFLLPFTLATSVPAQIMLGEINSKYIFALIVSSFVLFYLSRKFWHFALRHYTSASS